MKTRDKLPRLLVLAVLIFALASCVGGGGTNDNPLAGVEPAGQQGGVDETLNNDGFDQPTEVGVDTLSDLMGAETTKPDESLFGADEDSDESLFSGNNDSGAALGVDETDTPGDLLGDDTLSGS